MAELFVAGGSFPERTERTSTTTMTTAATKRTMDRMMPIMESGLLAPP